MQTWPDQFIKIIYLILMMKDIFPAQWQRHCTVIHPCWAGFYFNERKKRVIARVRRRTRK